MDQTARQRSAVLSIGGEIIDGRLRDIAEPHIGEHLVRAAARFLQADPGDFEERHGNVFDHGERTQQKRRGKDKSEAPGAEIGLRFRRERTNRNSREDHIARIGSFEEAEQAKQHMLSAALFAEDRVKAGRGEGGGHLVERRVFVSDARNSTKLDGRMRGRIQCRWICKAGAG